MNEARAPGEPEGEDARGRFGPRHVLVERAGEFLSIRNLQPLAEPWASVPDVLAHHATETPDRPFLCERVGRAWHRKSYGEVQSTVLDLAGRLSALGCTAQRPLAILGGNSILHAELALAAQHIGVACTPISPSYAAGPDLSRLRAMLELIGPGAIAFPEGQPSAAAIMSFFYLIQ